MACGLEYNLKKATSAEKNTDFYGLRTIIFDIKIEMDISILRPQHQPEVMRDENTHDFQKAI